MAGLEFFDRELRLATADLEPAAINAALAKFARAELAKAISAGASPKYDKFVNGVEGAQEETVRAPGPIVYEFVNWPLVINAALAELQRRSPRKSGRLASSFIVIAGGRVVVTDFTKLRADTEIIITGSVPYIRKAETGLLGVPAGRLFAGTKNVLSRRFKDVWRFEVKFLDIKSGLHPAIPYRLKRGQGRKGREAGAPISYPSLLINPA